MFRVVGKFVKNLWEMCGKVCEKVECGCGKIQDLEFLGFFKHFLQWKSTAIYTGNFKDFHPFLGGFCTVST